MSEPRIHHCAACEKTFDLNDKGAFKTCMHGGRHYYVCNSECMWAFYNPKTKAQAVADMTQAQAMECIVNAAREAHTAWLEANAERMQPDLSNRYTSRQASTEFALAMLRLGNALEGKQGG